MAVLAWPSRGSTWDPRRIVAQRGSIAGKRVARALRARYWQRVQRDQLPAILSPGHVNVDVLGFTCERDLPEQVLSMRTFLRYVGQPNEFVIVSDGSITPAGEAILRSQAPDVRVVTVEAFCGNAPMPPPVARFAADKAYGRKLSALISIGSPPRPMVYADCDVLFHRGGSGLARLLADSAGTLHFVEDCQPALDVRLVPIEERSPPLNSGFLVFGRAVDWTTAIERLGRIGEADAPGYGWTEQSVAHIAMRGSGALPLPRANCVVELSDQFRWEDPHTGPNVWLRHYVTGTRFKMWLCLLGAVQG